MNAPALAPALAQLLEHTADTVQGVREGRSLSDLLPRLPEPLRPGVQALAFLALRRLGAAMEVRAHLAPKTPPPAVEALLLTALALLWPDPAPPYPDHTLVDQAVAAARRRAPAAAAFVNAVLRRFLRERAACVQAATHSPLGAYNHPPWWVQRLREDWPAHWQALLHEANQRPPMTLRVNARRGSAVAYVERLARHGIVASPWRLAGPGADTGGKAARSAMSAEHATAPRSHAAAMLAEQAVVLAEPRAVSQLPGFAEGDVSVQDAAAQYAAPLLLGGAQTQAEVGAEVGPIGAAAAPGPAGSSRWPMLARLPAGAHVLDACAAPGGKTAHLLELADLDLVALDADAKRLARVHENLARLHLATGSGTGGRAPAPRVLAGDARQPAHWWDGRPFDAILLDAPCTASGIVRRHPDVRWLRRPADIALLAAVQSQMLEALWPLLAPGGRLLYATCSIFKAEGEHQIDAFLQRLGPAAARLWPHSPGHLLPLTDNASAGEPGVSSASAPSPKAATSDGFFYALIEKT